MWYFQLLIQNGAIVSLTNKYGETPLDKVKESLQDKLKGEAILELYRQNLLCFVNSTCSELWTRPGCNTLQE